MVAIRHILAAVSVIGTVLFGTIFLAASLFPLQVERVAKELIRAEVESRLREKLTSLEPNSLMGRAAALGEKLTREANATRSLINSELPKIIERELANMQDASCACRQSIVAAVTDGLKLQLQGLDAMRSRLAELVHSRYQETAAKLLRELRIFSGANALCFALLGVALWVRPLANVHVVPAALVLLLAAGVTAGFYLFAQDWFGTILFGDYVGLAYFAYLGVVFAMLVDVIMNRARVIAQVLKTVSNISLSPC